VPKYKKHFLKINNIIVDNFYFLELTLDTFQLGKNTVISEM